MDRDLQDFFSQAGVVTSVTLMLDKFTGKSRGFAFVEMTTDEEARKAMAALNGKPFLGRDLRVSEARPAKPREAPKEHKMSPLEEEMVKSIEEKAAKFGLDVYLPGMLTAVMARPPVRP